MTDELLSVPETPVPPLEAARRELDRLLLQRGDWQTENADCDDSPFDAAISRATARVSQLEQEAMR